MKWKLIQDRKLSWSDVLKMMATRNYVMKFRMKQSFPSLSHLQMCGFAKKPARLLQKMHQKQHSFVKSNHKDGTHQTLAETKPEIFSSRIYDQGLFDCNRTVTFPFPSLAEISVRPYYSCTVTVAQSNSSTMTARGPRAEWGSLFSPLPEQLAPVPEKAPPWARCSEHRCFPKAYWLKTSSRAAFHQVVTWVTGPRSRAAGETYTIWHSSGLTKKNKLCKSRIPRKD